MTRARLGALFFVCVLPNVLGPSLAGAQVDREVDRAFLFLIPGVSFSEMLASPDVASLATAGGAALLVPQGGLVADGLGSVPAGVRVQELVGDLDAAAAAIRRTISELAGERVLVAVASTTLSPAMRDHKDEVHPVVLTSGPASELFPDVAQPRALTSDSTRRSGVVSDLDVLATLAAAVGSPEPDAGTIIRATDDPAPYELYERYLAQRRLSVPFGVAVVAYLCVVGAVAIAFTLLGGAAPPLVRRAAGWGCLSVATLSTGMLAAGHLPELTYAVAVPMVAIVTVFGTMAFSPLERRDITLVPAGIGAAVVAFFAVEAILGWRGMVTPLLGASQLDGARFFGLPNVAVGLLVGAGLWVAQRLPTGGGFALLCGIGLL
ncbi:MAG TPA: hypothetical protein VF129_00345, partial [Actinomycetota bacterium]